MKKDARLDLRQTRILEDYFKRSADGATMEEVAKIHGINRKTLSIWKNTDHGNQLQDKFLLDLSATSKPKYFQVLNKKALEGSYKHMELYAKIHGMLAPQKQEVITKNENHNIVQDGLSKDNLKELESLLEEPNIKRIK